MTRAWGMASLSLIVVLFGSAALEAQTQQAGPQQQAVSPRKEVAVDARVRSKLDELGFAVAPSSGETSLARQYRLWTHEYLPVVVTSDAALHSCHLQFDWYLRFLEVAHLRDDLLNLTDALSAKMMAFHDESADARVKGAALADAAYLMIGKRLLTGAAGAGDAPEPWRGRIESELKLIRDASGFADSPLFGGTEDYSQYKPRGHYSRTEPLANYFRAMMWYGRMAFRCRVQRPEDTIEPTRRAMLICRALEGSKVKGEDAHAVWRRIYETTAFFAGSSDDLLPADYLDLMKKTASADPADDKQVGRLASGASNLRKPRILSGFALAPSVGGEDWRAGTAGMRLFGQRYALDSEVMQQLTFDAVKECLDAPKAEGEPFTLVNARGLRVRGLPRGLDVMAALGLPQAEALLKAGGDDRYEGYAAQLAKLKRALAATGEPQWQADLYNMRLNAMRLLASTPSGALPRAMKSEEWGLKQLTAALGSWTELRHDTILYTKQSYSMAQSAMAGLGKGGRQPPPPPPPRGYVEPVPDVYRALRLAVEGVLDKVKTLGYSEDKAFADHLARFAGHFRTLEEISRKELAGQALAESDYAFIRNIGYMLRLPEFGIPHHRDVTEEFREVSDDAMPIVAGVHTDPNSRMALEEGVGCPWTLYMVCPVDGRPTVCVGAVYSYYEFKQPMASRLTDEQWRQKVRGGAVPTAAWLDRYVVNQR